MKTIGEIIKEKRKAKHLTQKILAEQVGVNQNTLSAWEKGKFFPNALYCVSLADIFDCTIDELCGRVR